MKDYQKNTVAILLYNNEGDILAVSRKDDCTAFGLPGGKVEAEDESLEAAAIREVKEETGLDISLLRKIFSYKNEDKDTIGTTFTADWQGEINTQEKGVCKWTTFEELKKGPFGKYNAALERHLLSTI